MDRVQRISMAGVVVLAACGVQDTPVEMEGADAGPAVNRRSEGILCVEDGDCGVGMRCPSDGDRARRCSVPCSSNLECSGPGVYQCLLDGLCGEPTIKLGVSCENSLLPCASGLECGFTAGVSVTGSLGISSSRSQTHVQCTARCSADVDCAGFPLPDDCEVCVRRAICTSALACALPCDPGSGDETCPVGTWCVDQGWCAQGA